MSLEKEIAELREAIKENSELLKFLTSAAKGGLGDKAAAAKSSAKGDDKPKAEDKPKAASRSRASSKKEKVPSAKEMGEATTEFLDVDNEAEYKDRRALVVDIVGHFGVKKMSEIEEGDRQKALDMLETYKAGEDPFEGLGDDGDSGNKDDDLA
ncbi:hypothetical protein [Ochrobactrum sp. BTU2]|uniref:hypothetical protein n=1 Tax=Ochrobactrum sp. BTU2 TaxID=2856166 RepID=UPI00211A21A8|nr:hypothetical protein [Ochrobactrum sp. BTU2]MCQ9146110.1 hypothetical protein [Ochrobactrum sp. BTU2]